MVAYYFEIINITGFVHQMQGGITLESFEVSSHIER
jgi:hypothetical protein